MTKSVQFDPIDLLGAKLCDDRYKVLTRLGSGSMGHVFRAYDNRLESDVVIKVPTLSKLVSEEFRNRFARETTFMIRLSHPHVVKVIDIGEHENVPLVVMQYLPGGTLRDRMSLPDGRAYAMRPSSLSEWLPQIAKALDFVHGQNSIHRDVKPTNILFDDHGNAFLADFGLTKIMAGESDKNESDDTAAGFVVGTANYMAPEIVLAKDYDGRADQYSLGLTVYEALSATVPMHAANASATMVNQTHLKPRSLREHSPKIPAQVAAAVSRAISKRPKQRFENCSDFAEAVVSAVQAAKKRRSASADEGSTNRMSQANTRVRGVSRAKAKSSTSEPIAAGGSSRVRRRRDPLVGKMTFRKGDEVPCPKCREGLPVPNSFGGRTGRCVHCNVRVKIGDEAESLEIVAENKGNSSGSQELIIGEKVFGFEISTKLAVGLSLVLISILLVIAIVFTRWFTKEDPKPIHRTFEKREIHE